MLFSMTVTLILKTFLKLVLVNVIQYNTLICTVPSTYFRYCSHLCLITFLDSSVAPTVTTTPVLPDFAMTPIDLPAAVVSTAAAVFATPFANVAPVIATSVFATPVFATPVAYVAPVFASTPVAVPI